MAKPRLVFRNLTTGQTSGNLGGLLNGSFTRLTQNVMGIHRRNISHFLDLLHDLWVHTVQVTTWYSDTPAARGTIIAQKDIGSGSFSYGWHDFNGGDPQKRLSARQSIFMSSYQSMISRIDFGSEKFFLNSAVAFRNAMGIAEAHSSSFEVYIRSVESHGTIRGLGQRFIGEFRGI